MEIVHKGVVTRLDSRLTEGGQTVISFDWWK